MLFYAWSREITLLYVPFCGRRFGMSISESDWEENLTSEDSEISVISDFQLYVEEQSTLSDEEYREVDNNVVVATLQVFRIAWIK